MSRYAGDLYYDSIAPELEPPSIAKPSATGSCPNATMERPSCKRRSCPVCGPRWARDWQRVLAVNLAAAGTPVATIAITAPGKDRLPWACAKDHHHAGTKGCRCEPRALREWCETLPYRWQRFRQAARLATKRELGFVPPIVLTRVWEPQKRGAPHVHLVVPFGSPIEKQAAWTLLKHLRRLAAEYDFGDVQRRRGREKKDRGPDLQEIAGVDAARYLASYLAGRTSKKGSIRENIADPRLPRALLWLTPRLTRQTFVTMRTLRRARHLWAATEGRCPFPRWAGLEEAVRVVRVFRTIYPARAGPAGGDVAGALRSARLVDARLRPRLEARGIVGVCGLRMLDEDDAVDRDLFGLALAATATDEERAKRAELAVAVEEFAAAMAA